MPKAAQNQGRTLFVVKCTVKGSVMEKKKIKIDVVSDVVCPWCYIGKRRLEKAVEQLSGQYEFELNYHPFELNPEIPAEGVDLKVYLIQKFGGEQRYHQLTEHVKQVATGEGLKFDFVKQKTSPNTFDAHRIIWQGGKEKKQLPLVEALFKAYFEEGIDLSKKENLIAIAKENGLDENQVKALLDTNLGAYEVRSEEALYKNLGVSGVPFYIINDKYAISGAQPAEVFVEALQGISTEAGNEGEACDVDGGNC